MALKTIAVHLSLKNPLGSAIAGATVSFRLTSSEADGEIVVPKVVSGVTNGTGELTVNLWPTARGLNGSRYQVAALDSTGEKVLDVYITVPDAPVGTTLELHNLLNQSPYPSADMASTLITQLQALLSAYPALDEVGNLSAQVNHRINTFSNLNSLAGGNGEISVASDYKSLLVHNAVPGDAAYLADATIRSKVTILNSQLPSHARYVRLWSDDVSIADLETSYTSGYPVNIAPGIFTGQRVTYIFEGTALANSFNTQVLYKWPTTIQEFQPALGSWYRDEISPNKGFLLSIEFEWDGTKWNPTERPLKFRRKIKTAAITPVILDGLYIGGGKSLLRHVITLTATNNGLGIYTITYELLTKVANNGLQTIGGLTIIKAATSLGTAAAPTAVSVSSQGNSVVLNITPANTTQTLWTMDVETFMY